MAWDLDDPSIVNDFLKQSQEYFNPQKSKTAEDLNTVTEKHEPNIEVQRSPEISEQLRADQQGHQNLAQTTGPKPVLAPTTVPSSQLTEFEKPRDDRDFGAEALAAVARASKFGLNESRHSPTSKRIRAPMPEAKPETSAPFAVKKENLPITSGSSKSKDAGKMKSPGLKEELMFSIVSNAGIVSKEEKARAWDRVMRAFPGAAAEMLKTYAAKSVSDDGERATTKPGDSTADSAGGQRNIDYSKCVAVRNKGLPIRNPNYDPRESEEPVIASFASARRNEGTPEKSIPITTTAATNPVQVAVEPSDSFSNQARSESTSANKPVKSATPDTVRGIISKAEAEYVSTKVPGNVPVEEDREHAKYFSDWGEPQKRAGYIPARVRTIVLSGLPRDTTHTFVQSLIFGGTLQEIRLTPQKTTAYVTYIDPDKCEKFYNAHPNGIAFASTDGKKTFCAVNRSSDVEPISGVVQAQLECGATRAVVASGVDEDWTIRALHKIGEVNGGTLVDLYDSIREDGSRVVMWCFAKMADATHFRYYLQNHDDFELCKVEFTGDPSAGGAPSARGVHMDCKGQCRF